MLCLCPLRGAYPPHNRPPSDNQTRAHLMLAGKIFSADPIALTAPVLDLCEQHPSEYGVELALYGAPHFDPVSEQRIHMLAPSRKSLHSLHRCMGLTELAAGDAAALDRLSAEAAKARELGISRYV